MDRTTVVIVGAGPAGLVLGHLLQRDDVPFVLVERHRREDLRAFPKAGLIEFRTVRLLTDEGIAGPVLQFEHENHRCEFRTPDERVVFDYGALTGGRPHFIYPQHELVANLCDAVIDGGGDVRFGVEATAVERRPDGVSVRVTEAGLGDEADLGGGGRRPRDAVGERPPPQTEALAEATVSRRRRQRAQGPPTARRARPPELRRCPLTIALRW